MEWELVGVDRQDRRIPVVVDAGDRATVADLRRALAPMLGTGDALYAGQRRLDGGARLAESGLYAGAEVGTAPVPVPAGSTDGWELAAVGGRSAGEAAPVPAGGTVEVGRSPECALGLDDPGLGRRHAAVTAAEAGTAVLTDLGSPTGIGWQGHRLAGAATLGDGDVFTAGDTVIELRRLDPPGADPRPGPGGTLRYDRPPRPAPLGPPAEVRVPAVPTRPRGFRLPYVVVLLPVLAGVCYLLLPHTRYYLVFLALTPLAAAVNLVAGRREHQAAMRGYAATLATLAVRVSLAATQEGRAARRAYPDPAAVLHIAVARTRRLFERRPTDDDFLRVRVGLTDRPAAVRLGGPGADGYPRPTVHAVPVTVDLTAAGVLGIAGPRTAVLGLARAMLIQAAALHAPDDLAIVVLTGRDEAPSWDWATWLPHTLPDGTGSAGRRLVATDAAQAQARLAELRRLINRRRSPSPAGDPGTGGIRTAAPPAGEPCPGRRILVVVDGARRFRAFAGLTDLLTDGPEAGVYALCLDADESHLPDERGATVVVAGGSGTRARVTRPGRAPDRDVLVDALAPRRAAEAARALAPIRLPADTWPAIRLLALPTPDTDPAPRTAPGTGVELRPGAVAAGWAARAGDGTAAVTLGAGTDGPVVLDLRGDGPHALVAGGSPADRSELLRTVVAGLALAHGPDRLNVVLVDYQGGEAFAGCRDLPHCVGLVSNLDGHLVGRPRASLAAELRRRDELLAAAGVPDIDGYRPATGERLPRLVIVVDEYAAVLAEAPDFAAALAGVGARGRDLGVHVILATGRPGNLAADLRVALDLRICLPVATPADSIAVLGVPDAALTPTGDPDLAYVRTARGDLTTLRTARVSQPHPRTGDADDTVRVALRRVADLGLPRTDRDRQVDTEPETDLSVLVSTLRAAAGQAALTAPAGPWLPPLPRVAPPPGSDPPPVPNQSATAGSSGLTTEPSPPSRQSGAGWLNSAPPRNSGPAVWSRPATSTWRVR